MAAVAHAFDREAAAYDARFGGNPVGLRFRHLFQERLALLCAPARRVLDLGCGTGDDAVFLALRGKRVHALDVSPAMVEAARTKALSAGVAAAVTTEVRSAETVGEVEGPFDAAYSDFGALNCTDLVAVGRGLARVLRPGAPLLLSLLGPWPLPAVVRRALTGLGEARRGSRPAVGGVAIPVAYPSPGEARETLGDAFSWTGTFALGVVVPSPAHEDWVQRHPQTFGVLSSLERLVCAWPLLRALGDHVVLEGRRR